MKNFNNHVKGKKFGELILYFLKSHSPNDLLNAFNGFVMLLPEAFQNREIEKLIDIINEKAYERTFWQADCAEQFSYISEITKGRFSKVGLDPTEDDIFYVINIIMLNFAYSASQHNKMKAFIKAAVGNNLFRNIFRKKDISERYRWSVVFKKAGIPHYEMLGDNVISIIGNYMICFAENGNPPNPWELLLRHNKSGESIQLTKEFFPNSDTISSELLQKIELIDAGYQVTRFKEEIFIDRISGNNIKISSINETKNDMLADLKSISDGTYEERRRKKESEVTFYKVLKEVFE